MLDLVEFLHNYGVLIFGAIIVFLAIRVFRKKSSSQQGSTIFLLGESGSGKTSLLYYVKNNFDKIIRSTSFS